MVADFVERYGAEEFPLGCAVGCGSEGVLPVLDLRIAGEEKEFLADLEEQNEAGVVHRAVDDAHELEELGGVHRLDVAHEPARRNGECVRLHRGMVGEESFDCFLGGDLRRGGLELPELRGVARTLFADRIVLLDGRRTEDVNLDARQHASAQGCLRAVREVFVLVRHRHQVLHGREVLEVRFAQESEAVAEGRADTEAGDEGLPVGRYTC